MDTHAPRNTWTSLITPALAAGVLGIAATAQPMIGAALVALAAVALFAARPMLGWGLVVLAYPFIYLQLFIGQAVNVPYVDVFALLTTVGLAVRMAYRAWRLGERPRMGGAPGIVPFLLFVGAAALSLVHAEDPMLGVKFLVRPLTFFYLMFIVLPLTLLDRPHRLFTTLRLMFVVGLLAAAMGAWSLIAPPEPGAFRRAVPVIVHGMTPLGTNHNLIAEVLVSVIPIGALLAVFSRGRAQRWYIVGTAFLALITLLTFSRNGWLTLTMESVVLLVAFARARGITWQRIFGIAAPALAVAGVAIGLFSLTTVAQSSNTNRIHLTRIAFEQFRAHPLTGSGIGTFQEAVSRDAWYIADFGTPQEAHGLIQKLLAETGLLGLLTFSWLLAALLGVVLRAYRHAVVTPQWRLILLALLCSASGSIIFQLFNTSYFVSKLWLPIGLAVAAARLAEQKSALRTS
ncbi:MAG: O-antigen ligase family protein [bacterium]|nr:O-antigen ligase family protein [bacterium]